jgi:methylated-DNA-[protein]-cysteine S-methyltransferase
MSNPIEIEECDSPIGAIKIAHRGGRVCGLAFADRWDRAAGHLRRRFGCELVESTGDAQAAVGCIRRYFAGDLPALGSIEIELKGTPFQLAVWHRLRAIPPGTTESYGSIAWMIGEPSAVRAVGAANGSNLISLVIPCHRVIGADGSLVNYGGGIERKRWLIEHEKLSLLRAGQYHCSPQASKAPIRAD